MKHHGHLKERLGPKQRFGKSIVSNDRELTPSRLIGIFGQIPYLFSLQFSKPWSMVGQANPVQASSSLPVRYSQTHDVCEHNYDCIHQNYEARADFLRICNSSCVHKRHAFTSTSTGTSARPVFKSNSLASEAFAETAQCLSAGTCVSSLCLVSSDLKLSSPGNKGQ